MFDLTGKKALITGASGGIGEAIARTLHAQGAEVGLHGTRKEKLETLAADLGERAHVLAANLSDPDELAGLIERAAEAMGQIDILVNNAGITRDGLFVRMSDKDWSDVIDINLTAVFKLTRDAVYPMMRRRGGRIINITSIVGVTGNPGQGNYCASKAGIIGMSKSLAMEIASRKVTVNCIAPGFIETPMTDALNDKQKETILASVPAKRLGSVDEVASAVVWLAADETSYVTGQTIHINGGMAMI